MRLIWKPSGYQIHARQMGQQLDEVGGFRIRIMDFHPGLDSGCRQDNVPGTDRGLRDPVTVPGQKTPDCDARSAAGVIVSVIGQNEDFQLLSFTGSVDGAQFLEFFVESAKHRVDVAPQMLGAVC